jgi:hypothetical protein
LLKFREKEVHDGESEDENEEDDTLFKYCSENERGATTEVDNDDVIFHFMMIYEDLLVL